MTGHSKNVLEYEAMRILYICIYMATLFIRPIGSVRFVLTHAYERGDGLRQPRSTHPQLLI